MLQVWGGNFFHPIEGLLNGTRFVSSHLDSCLWNAISTSEFSHGWSIYTPPTAPPKKEALIAGLISLSTETKRSCLGGFGGAAGSDTSWYDFCHDQSKLACHKMTSIFNAATHRPLASASS